MIASSDDSMIDASSRAVSSWLAPFTLHATLRGDIPEDQHASGHDAALVADRRGAVVDRALAAVLADEHRVIRQADDHALRAAPSSRGFRPGCARVLADDAEHGVERLADGVGRVQPVSDSATAFM